MPRLIAKTAASPPQVIPIDSSPTTQHRISQQALKKVAEPDVIERIKLDRRTLPKGTYHDAGVVTQQVFDIDITRVVTEYQAQALKND